MTYKSRGQHQFAQSRRAWLRRVACLLLTLSGIPLAAASPVELVRIGFYEGRSDNPVPAWDNPRVTSTFAQGDTRSVFTLFQIRGMTAAADETHLRVRYLHPDGHQLGEDRIEPEPSAADEAWSLVSGWGWDTPGHWEAGIYRVEIRLDDETLIDEASFLIKADTRFVTRTGGIRLEQMGFYEAGDDGMDQAPENWSDDRLREQFTQSEARYIFTMVRLKNLKWNIEDQEVRIHLYYYRSDGEMVGDPVIDYTIPADWETAELWNGWGWPEAGNWQPGEYRVELWLDDTQKIGQSHFNVD